MENMLNKFDKALRMDGVWPRGMEIHALYSYRYNENPLSVIRKWLKRHNIPLRVDYMENEEKVSKQDVLDWVQSKKVPMLVLFCQKVEGHAKFVKLYFVTKDRECLDAEYWAPTPNRR